jgi:hypothetical protein
VVNLDRKNIHVVMYSGGASSAFVANHVVQRYGKENTILFFTNTLWEDQDNYRFLEEVSEYIGVPITERIDGRTPEEVFYDYDFLGNTRMAKCSEELKVRQTIMFIEELRNEGLEPILYFGIGPHEGHRAESIQYQYTNLSKNDYFQEAQLRKMMEKNIYFQDHVEKVFGENDEFQGKLQEFECEELHNQYAKSLRSFYEHNALEPVETRFPMIDIYRKDLNVKDIIEYEWGIRLPRMYKMGYPKNGKVIGFSHANCGGRCVRGGLGHYALLYKVWPEQYKEQEEMEDRFRAHYNKDVSIMKQYTLREYREILEREGVDKYVTIVDEPIHCICSFS